MGKLVQAGARQINQRYGPNGEIEGIDFSLEAFGKTWIYRLPAKHDGVFQILQGRRQSWNRSQFIAKDRAQAHRIAWRQLLRWVEVQLAMIQTCQAEAAQVFMPYVMIPGTDKTMYETFVDQQKLLPAPPENGNA